MMIMELPMKVKVRHYFIADSLPKTEKVNFKRLNDTAYDCDGDALSGKEGEEGDEDQEQDDYLGNLTAKA